MASSSVSDEVSTLTVSVDLLLPRVVPDAALGEGFFLPALGDVVGVFFDPLGGGDGDFLDLSSLPFFPPLPFFSLAMMVKLADDSGFRRSV
jgi:hypothetical protein